MCDCLTLVNEQLAARNGRVATGFLMTPDMDVKLRVLVATEKLDKAKRKPVPPLSAAFCPFCGQKVE